MVPNPSSDSGKEDKKDYVDPSGKKDKMDQFKDFLKNQRMNLDEKEEAEFRLTLLKALDSSKPSKPATTEDNNKDVDVLGDKFGGIFGDVLGDKSGSTVANQLMVVNNRIAQQAKNSNIKFSGDTDTRQVKFFAKQITKLLGGDNFVKTIDHHHLVLFLKQESIAMEWYIAISNTWPEDTTLYHALTLMVQRFKLDIFKLTSLYEALQVVGRPMVLATDMMSFKDDLNKSDEQLVVDFIKKLGDPNAAHLSGCSTVIEAANLWEQRLLITSQATVAGTAPVNTVTVGAASGGETGALTQLLAQVLALQGGRGGYRGGYRGRGGGGGFNNRGGYNNRGGSFNTNRGGYNNNGQFNGTCFNCGNIGHKAGDCRAGNNRGGRGGYNNNGISYTNGSGQAANNSNVSNNSGINTTPLNYTKLCYFTYFEQGAGQDFVSLPVEYGNFSGNFKLDTCAMVSIIPVGLYNSIFGNVALRKSSFSHIAGPTGANSSVLGDIFVNLLISGRSYESKLTVVDADVPLLFGIPWIKRYVKSWNFKEKWVILDGDSCLHYGDSVVVDHSQVATLNKKPQDGTELVSNTTIISNILGTSVATGEFDVTSVEAGGESNVPENVLTSDIDPSTYALDDSSMDAAAPIFDPVLQAAEEKRLKDVLELKITKNNILLGNNKVDEWGRMMSSNLSAFSFGKFTTANVRPFKIEVPANVVPYVSKPRLYDPAKELVLHSEVIDKLYANGVIKRSTSPWSSELLLIKKKDGTYRVVNSFVYLNMFTTPWSYPHKATRNILNKLGGMKYFTKLDCCSGYWQVPMDPDSTKYTAFGSPFGHFEFVNMPMGVTNAPSHFQSVIDELYLQSKFPYKENLFNYQDDLLIGSPDLESHKEHVDSSLAVLRSVNLKLKVEKCFFAQTEVEFLGHIISADGIKMDVKKLAAIAEWPQPKNIKDVQSFLGFLNYYRDFVPYYAKCMQPLYDTILNGKFVWSDQATTAFKNSKIKYLHNAVLSFPDYNLPFYMTTDAMPGCIAGVFWQLVNGIECPIAFFSKKLVGLGRNSYEASATECELLAVIFGLSQFAKYAQGHVLHVLTDHAALKWLYSLDHPQHKYARWLSTIAANPFVIEHRAGKSIPHMDALSRIHGNAVKKAGKANEFNEKVFEALPGDLSGITSTDLAAKSDKLFDSMVYANVNMVGGYSLRSKRNQESNLSALEDKVFSKKLAKLKSLRKPKVDVEDLNVDANGDLNDDISPLTGAGEEVIDGENNMIESGEVEAATYEVPKFTAIESELGETDGVVQQTELLKQEMEGLPSGNIVLPKLYDEDVLNKLFISKDLPKEKKAELDLSSILEMQKSDSDISVLCELVKNGNSGSHKFSHVASNMYLDDKGVLWFAGRNLAEQRLVVSNELGGRIVDFMHRGTYSIHYGIAGIYRLVQQRFYFVNMVSTVRKVVQSCKICQMYDRKVKKYGKTIPIIASKCGEIISMDFYGRLSPTTDAGNSYVLVVSDICSHAKILIACPDQTADTVIQCVMNDIIPQWGTPLQIVTDHGTCFTAGIFKRLCANLGIHHVTSVVGNPESNGMTERFNRTLRDKIAKLTDRGKNWDKVIKSIEFNYNATPILATGMSPFKLRHGYDVRLPVDIALFTKETIPLEDRDGLSLQYKAVIWDQIFKETRMLLENLASKNQNDYSNKMIAAVDKKVLDPGVFKVGTLVTYYDGDKKGLMKPKFVSTRSEPYVITALLGKNIYQLRSMKDVTDYKVVNVKYLNLYYPAVLDSQAADFEGGKSKTKVVKGVEQLLWIDDWLNGRSHA